MITTLAYLVRDKNVEVDKGHFEFIDSSGDAAP